MKKSCGNAIVFQPPFNDATHTTEFSRFWSKYQFSVILDTHFSTCVDEVVLLFVFFFFWSGLNGDAV